MQGRKASKCLLLALIWSLLLLAGKVEAADRKDQLKSDEQRVINYLLGDWGKDYSVTSVDIAMRAVGVKQSIEARFRIGSHIKAHPELHEVIRRWGWVTLVLTPDEKLIARALINAERDGDSAPGLPEIAKAVGLSQDQVKQGLSMLERHEIIERDPSRGGAGYKVRQRYLKWEPRLDFLFHKVALGNGREFNTN